MLTLSLTPTQAEWDSFLTQRQFRPFLQSWTMGEVYRSCSEEPLRIAVHDGDVLVGICQALVIPARRGRHLAVLYGPIVDRLEALKLIAEELKTLATAHRCSFIRCSPFVPAEQLPLWKQHIELPLLPSPLHLLGEHVWYIPLRTQDPWQGECNAAQESAPRTPDDIMADMRNTTRNLIRRAQKEGVCVVRSEHPQEDIEHFLKLHEETRKRHGFTPYKNSFFRAQVEQFAPRGECTLYLAWYQGAVLASSIHMHIAGETSYHHGASTHAYPKIPASTLLQWTAISDALQRGDHVYSFWGIAPEGVTKHPFAGVTTFKRGFGGSLLPLMHCQDIPLQRSYHLTRAFEQLRKWRRGF